MNTGVLSYILLRIVNKLKGFLKTRKNTTTILILKFEVPGESLG